MKKIYLLRGNTGSGKTTRLKEWIGINKAFSSFSGVLSPVINGKRYFMDISTEELIPMESGDITGQLKVGRYSFSESSFIQAGNILKKAFENSNGWIIIDEFGPLELQGKGLYPAITKLIRSPQSFNLLIVVRDSLFQKLLNMYSIQEDEYELFNFQSLSISASILAGGESSRMGEEKALLKFGEVTLIEKLLRLLKKYFIDIKVVTNDPDKFSFLNIPLESDLIKGYGPLSGIHTVLKKSGTDKNIIISCDMPFLSESLFSYLIGIYPGKHCVLFNDRGFIQPFPGVYSRGLLPLIEKYIHSNTKSGSIYKLISSASDIEIIDVRNLDFNNPNLFFNMNSSEDYYTALQLYS